MLSCNTSIAYIGDKSRSNKRLTILMTIPANTINDVKSGPPQTRWYYSLLIWGLLFVFCNLGQRHELWAPDEPREAEIAREMFVTGDWIIPQLNGTPFLEKPPLTHWGGALVFTALGKPSAQWCRLVNALWGFLGAAALVLLCSSMANRYVGFIAGFMLATNVEWALNSRMLH
ncbi:MAG: hypothetical protein PVJ60_10230, partial [Phycisphaerales bacterium]